MPRYQLKTNECCAVNDRIAKEMGLDGVESKHPFHRDGTILYGINDDNKHLLSDSEIEALEPYEPPEIEEI